MKKSLKIFALAASLLQAVLFSAFAANPPSDFTYELINNNQAVKITGLKNKRTDYEIPASIEDFPVAEVKISADKGINITLPEGVRDVSIWSCTVNQLPSTVKKIELGFCRYNGTLPAEIEEVIIKGTGTDIKLNQNLSELKNLKELRIEGKKDNYITLIFDSELQNCDNFYLSHVNVFNKTPLKDVNLDNVNLFNNTTVYIDERHVISNTNVEELIFEEGVTSIEASYSDNKNLKKIVLPSTLQSVNLEIFTNCPNLSEVVVPDLLLKVNITEKLPNGRYRSARNLADIFDTTSLPLKNQARLNQVFFPEN